MVVYYTRLTQRLVAALTVPTRRGLLYEVDLRLRPQGGKGPVASQFRGFVDYQKSEAELWEHMALTRARVIAGDEAFGARVAHAVAGHPRARRAIRQHVFKEVARHARADRAGKGRRRPVGPEARPRRPDGSRFHRAGAGARPSRTSIDARRAHRPKATFAAGQSVGLLAEDDARTLIEAHQLFNDIFQWQRLTIEGAFDAEKVPPAILKRLATVAGLPSAKVLLEQSRRCSRSQRDFWCNGMVKFNDGRP